MTKELMSLEEINKCRSHAASNGQAWLVRICETASSAHMYRLAKEGAQMERDQLKEENERLLKRLARWATENGSLKADREEAREHKEFLYKEMEKLQEENGRLRQRISKSTIEYALEIEKLRTELEESKKWEAHYREQVRHCF